MRSEVRNRDGFSGSCTRRLSFDVLGEASGSEWDPRPDLGETQNGWNSKFQIMALLAWDRMGKKNKTGINLEFLVIPTSTHIHSLTRRPPLTLARARAVARALSLSLSLSPQD
ncbi:hypothetical protein ACMYSQ_010086 [Aspergillus niger]